VGIGRALKWWGLTAEFIKHHHDNEEHLFFPKIAERVQLPARLNTDHTTLLAMLTKTEAELKAALAGGERPAAAAAAAAGGLCVPLAGPTGFAAVLASMQALHDHMLPHLLEEEANTLPAMMKAFKAKEFVKLEQKMIKTMPWYSLMHLYRRLKGDRAAAKVHALSLGVPALAFDLFIVPKLDRYDAEFGWIALELLTPNAHPFFEEQRALAKRRSGVCGCLAPRPKPQQAVPA
jgi:hypothetical protein